ncbi:MAG: septal ring lytic transglycosylase RlpA family protein [Thiotrichales bacterium]|nr:septal ring lytic transglycosylase RlpA family protein [Thiotrichales bacterium]
MTSFNEVGKASFYASSMKRTRTASGALYHPQLKTAAHRSLPFGTRLKVTHLKNGKSVVVVVNDRGPFVKGRVIDLSQAAFRSLAQLSEGVVRVKIEVLTASPSVDVKKDSHENTKK